MQKDIIMPRFNSETLITHLKNEAKDIFSVFNEKIKDLEEEILNVRPEKNKWSALECVEHLNMVGRYYLPRMEAEINKAILKGSKSQIEFKSGFMGNYMYNAMKPTSDRSIQNKMKTFKSVNPAEKYNMSKLDAEIVIKNFKEQQQQYLNLLEKGKQVDLNSVKITSLIGPILKLKIGDVYRFLLGHIERHLIQAENAFKEKNYA